MATYFDLLPRDIVSSVSEFTENIKVTKMPTIRGYEITITSNNLNCDFILDIEKIKTKKREIISFIDAVKQGKYASVVFEQHDFNRLRLEYYKSLTISCGVLHNDLNGTLAKKLLSVLADLANEV